jgi:hypothetical protein
MADENKPAFYPRVGNIKAKNFKPAQPMPFVYDERAMELPDYKEFIPKLGTVDLSVPSKENRELNRRITERDADLMRQVQADRSPLEKLAGGLQAGRFLGSAMTQGINAIPTQLFSEGTKAEREAKAEKFIQDRLYKPEQPVAYEYAQDVGDFLDKLETEYKIPPVLPEAVALQFLTGPATAQAARAAGRGAEQAGRAIERRMEPVVKGAFERGGLPREMVMAMGANTQSNVVKPRGGNWLAGSVEKVLDPLIQKGTINNVNIPYGPEFDAAAMKRIAELKEAASQPNYTGGAGRVAEHLERDINNPRRANEAALNKWIQSNLTNYVKKDMGTPEDPVRRLADEGISHLPLDTPMPRNMSAIRETRKEAGFPEPYGKSWQGLLYESLADKKIGSGTAGEMINTGKGEPWMNKVDPFTRVHGIPPMESVNFTQDLGFNHIVDVLRQDVAAGRIRPEQLNKVSMEQAVRRTYEYDQEMARKMQETALQQQEGFPTYKEYPEGYKWVELNQPKDLPEGWKESAIVGTYYDEAGNLQRHPREKIIEDALKYEGDTMGHCVGGYCPDVLEGKSRIFSLRDAKGEPHVTVEVQPKGAVFSDVAKYIGKEEADRLLDQGLTLSEMIKNIPDFQYPQRIQQIKGKGNAKPKEDYLPYVQDFVKGGKWTEIGDFQNTGLIREGGQLMTPAEHSDWLLKQLDVPPAEGMKRGGKVSISNNPDTMMLEVNNQKMKNGEPAYAGGKGVFAQGMKAARPAMSEAERALPLRLPRAMPKSKAEINAHAERVARQMMGEHVTSGKAGDTKNLAGRSMKESQRVKNLEYEFVPTKDVPESQVYQPRIGDINVALGGDFTLSDVELKSLMGEPINSRQEGGSRYGLGHLEDELPLFYASNEVPAQAVQNKVTDLYDLYGPRRIMGHHMAMGPAATNFAQHFADANLKYTDYSKLRPQDMYEFDKIISEGFVTSKKDKKTGETVYKIVDFPNWPGIADPQAAYDAMKENSEMRKWYNRVMQTPKLTKPLNFPSGQDVRYAITSPDLRDMEVNLTGHGVGELVPNVDLTDTANHNTYRKGIRGLYEGHQEVLSPFAISFPDATQHIITHQRPSDFTGTIQKVFPHQRVDQQFIDEMEQYRRRIKELTGKKKGGAVKKAEGGYLKKPAAYINGDEFVNAAKKYGIKDSMNNLNKIVDLVNKGLSVDDAARQVADTGMHKAAGGAISGDDLILEERPL